MRVKKIIRDAAEILGLTDVAVLVDNGADESELRENSNYRVLLRCLNLVSANISSNYIDCIATQKFEVMNGRIEIKDFKRTFLKVKEVRVGRGQVSHELFIGFIRVPRGSVTVTYACVPEFKTANESARILGLPAGTIVYGLLAEYAFVSGMFNEAKVWNEKFEQLLFGKRNTGRARVMPLR
jgi:hypothetical protein